MATTFRSLMGRGARLQKSLYRPIDPSSLVLFRVAFGALVVWEMIRFFDRGWIERHYQEPELLFKYWLFGWVDPLPGVWLAVVFAAVGVAGLLVAVGAFYRVSATVVFLGLWYIFLLDKARYLNHWYLLILVAFLLVFMPAGKAYSLDANRKGDFTGVATIPTWPVWLLRFQVGVVYFFGGLAKINADWLRGEPIATWLAAQDDLPIIGSWLANRTVGVTLGYAALVFDLVVVFLLLNRRTRPFAFIGVIGFHLLNDSLFTIGVFPWFAIAATTIFFDPDWPKQIRADLRAENTRGTAFIVGFLGGAVLGAWYPPTFVLVKPAVMAVACGLAAHQLVPAKEPRPAVDETAVANGGSRLAVSLMAVWVAIQLILPLRHFVVPGNVHWTEEGHRYAWHMKLRDKDGFAEFVVVNPDTGETIFIDPDEHLSSRQASRAAAIPDIAVQFANYLEDVYAAGTDADLEVYVDGLVDLNGREPQPLFDPNADLTRVRIPSFGADWLVPLNER